MTPISRPLVVAFLLLAAHAVPGEPAYAQDATVSFPHETSPFGLAPDPGIVWGRTGHGLRYAVMANATPPDVVVLRMRIAVGSLDEPAELNGIAHLLEHLAFQRTERRPDSSLFPTLERLGIAAGRHSNASTGLEDTEYRLELPHGDPNLLAEAMSVLRDIADGLLLDPADIEQERAVAISELRGRDDDSAEAQRALMRFLAPGAPAARQWPGGSVETLSAIDRDDLLDFQRRHYRPERMTIAIVGDIDVAAAEALLLDRFADFRGVGSAAPAADREAGIDLPRRLRAGVTIAPALPARLGVYFSRDYVSLLRESISYAGPNRLAPGPGDVATLRRELLQRDFARNFIAAAFRRRMSELGFAEAPGFASAAPTAFPIARAGYFDGFAFAPVGADWRAALAVARRELERLLRHGLTARELDLARRSVENALDIAVRRAATRHSAGLAADIVSATAEGFVVRHPEDVAADFEAVAPRITLDRVNRLIREAWDGVAPAIHLRLPEAAEGEDATMLLAAWSGAAASVVEPWPEREETAFAYGDFGPPGEIVERSRIEDFGIERTVFANHVVAHVRPTDFERDTVRFLIRIGGGASAFAPDEANLMLKAGQWAVLGGLGAHDAPELSRMFADKSVSVRFGIDMNGIAIVGAALESDLPLALARATAMIVDPAFRAEAEPLFARRMGDFYESVRSSPSGVLQIDAMPFLQDGDRRPAGLPASLARALEPDRETVIARLMPLLARDYLEIAMVGDIAPERAEALISATLGALPERAERPSGTRRELPRIAAAGSAARFAYVGKDAGGLVARVWPLRDAIGDGEARALQLLGEVLDIRAREVVREAGGQSYAPRASVLLDPEAGWRGWLMLSADGPSDGLGEIGTELEGLLAGIAGGELDEDTLERARRPALEQVRALRDSNGGWLYGILDGLDLAPGRLDRLRGVEAGLAGLGIEDIRDAAERLTGGGAPLSVEILPEGGG